MRDIGRAAGKTQGTIYSYVRSKDDILYLVCDRIVSECQEETRKALASSHDPAARIRSAVHAVCEVMYQHQEEILLIYQDSHLLEPRSLRVIPGRDMTPQALLLADQATTLRRFGEAGQAFTTWFPIER